MWTRPALQHQWNVAAILGYCYAKMFLKVFLRSLTLESFLS